MSAQPFFNAIQNSSFSAAIAQLPILWGAFAQIVHIAGLILVLTPVVIINLRLLGFGLTEQPVRRLAYTTRHFFWTGVVLLALSGLFIFIPAANIYYVNSFFWYKFWLIIAVVVLHFVFLSSALNAAPGHILYHRILPLISLLLWFGIGAAGRIIGFVN